MRSLPPLIRYCFSKLWNRQFLIFLFFLALSTTFWLFQALNETYEEDFLVPIELRGVPTNVVITSDLPTHLRATLRDKGIVLLSYKYTNRFKPVVIDFSVWSTPSGHIVIEGADLSKQVSAQLMGSTQLLSVNPDALDFYYNYGEYKRVPVVLQGRAKAARLYALSDTRLSQDSVTVYASRSQLDTITAAWVQSFDYRNLSDTTRVEGNFVRVAGAKFVPARVGITFCIDRMVEKSVMVPVQQVNFPATKQLRTFPASVQVTFQVAMGLYRRITSESFVLVVNYEDLLQNRGTSCHLSLKTIPAGVSHVRITPQDVEYIIEEIPENAPDIEGE